MAASPLRSRRPCSANRSWSSPEIRFSSRTYAYCDQCCRECRASSRCLAYHVEQSDSLDSPSHAQDPPLSDYEFASAVAEATGTATSELDVMLSDPSAPLAGAAIGEPLELLGRHYALQLGAFLRSVEPSVWEEPNDGAADALAAVAWFHMIIPVKICRALVSAHRTSDVPSLHEDALASAKLVLVAVQRSRDALVAVAHLDARAGALIELLDTIRDAVDRRFPGAWKYARPGLDVDASECPAL